MQSQYLRDEDERPQFDRESLEIIANLKGISVAGLLAEIERGKELSRLAWRKCRRRNKAARPSEVTAYMHIVSFESQTLLYCTNGGTMAVAQGTRTRTTTRPREALHWLACGIESEWWGASAQTAVA